MALFKTFDIDETGQISRQNIKEAFTKFGKEVTEEELDEIMKEHDTSRGNSITMGEFVAMFGPIEKR
jgi:Ca2+-binding EF-hand superfamily protein